MGAVAPAAPASAVRAAARWRRIAPLGPPGPSAHEIWERTGADGARAEAEVAVTRGKDLDVLGLRPIDPDKARAHVAGLAATARALGAGPTVARTECPCCSGPVAAGDGRVTILERDYVTCPGCGHVFVREIPAPEALAERFAGDDALAHVYTDAAALELRMEQIVRPKLDWVREVAAGRGRPAGRVVDLGAGGGHFVAAAARAGLDATGYEISRASCRFAREALGVELIPGDIADAAPPDPPADVVTLWGVLEYVAEPRDVLAHAARFLAPEGLLVVEVPRADALSSAVQRALPRTVWRHLEPTSHLNAFSDASLATLLWEAGFAPVAAWYFGMDVYELLCQLALRLPAGALDEVAPALLEVQAAVDAAGWSDDVIVAARRR